MSNNLDLETIKKAIKEWDDYRSKLDRMQSLFTLGNCITFELPTDVTWSDESFIHAYIGVIKGSLKLLLIPASKDNKEQQNIQDHVKSKTVDFSIGPAEKSDRVDPEEAEKRIANWNLHYPSWLQAKIDAKEPIQQVYVIPKRYLDPDHEYMAFFALKDKNPDVGGVTAYEGDMMIWDQQKEKVVYPFDSPVDDYFNTVYLVPPFGDKIPSKEKFYLLALSNASGD